MRFCEYITMVRAECGLTQLELVEILINKNVELFSTLTASTLSRWENGFSAPSLEKKQSILRHFIYNYPSITFENIEAVEDHFYRQITVGYLEKMSEIQYNFPIGDVEIEDLAVYNLHEYPGIDGVVERTKHLKKAVESSYSTLTKEKGYAFSQYKSNIYIVVDYKGLFLGFFSAVKLKADIFEKVISFEMKIQDIEEEHLVMDDEKGSLFLLFFFSLNLKVTARLNIRFLSYLIKNQKMIEKVGALVSNKISTERIKTFNMKAFKSTTLEDGVKLTSYQANAKEVMLSEYCVKKFFLPE